MQKKVLLLCASHNDLGLIKSLRALGYHITSTGMIPDLPGQKYVDKYVQMDYSDKDKILQLAKDEKINVICQCCNDFGVYTAAYVAEQLGLPGYDSYETTLLLHNKDQFKQFAQKYHIPSVPSFAFTDWQNALNYCKNAPFPLIVKPTDASAGNGISRMNSYAEAETAIQTAFQQSRTGKIVIERFLTGSQHGFCTFLINRKVIAYCSNNEYSLLNPYRVEIDTWPADHDKDFRDILIAQIEKIADILHLKDGIFHLQYIVENGNPYIIEVMRRVLGNMYGIPAGRVSGFDWDYWECRAKTGLSCENAPRAMEQQGFFAYKTILAERNGIIDSITIPPSYAPYVWDQFLLKAPGMTVTRYASEPLGFLFMAFPSDAVMKKTLLENYRNDCVKMKDQ